MPIVFVVTCVATPVERLRIVTLAAGITAPEGSVTVPDRMAPTTRPHPPADTTTPRIAVNQEAKDAATQLSLLQQEVYMAQQQIMFLSLRGFEDHMTAKRVMFPSGKEIVPGYIFTPRQIDRNK